MTHRTYTIETRLAHDGQAPTRTYRSYVLHTEGTGHWCAGSRECGTFTSEADAIEAGNIWLELGLAPFEQTPERVERARARRLERDEELLANAGIRRAA